MGKLTENQKTAIRCAYADLVGAIQARNQMDIEAHDWHAHFDSIIDMENEFRFLEPMSHTIYDFDED